MVDKGVHNNNFAYTHAHLIIVLSYYIFSVKESYFGEDINWRVINEFKRFI